MALINLQTLGCRLNEAEVETWAREFQASGHSITQEITAADVVVLNSCAVTADAGRKSRQMIRRIHRQNPSAKLVASGCYASLEPEQVAKIGIDLLVTNRDKSHLVTKTLTALDLAAMPNAATEPAEYSLFNSGRQRAFVKVQDGCRYRCSFCIVTVARGEELSRPVVDIISEINHLAQQGIMEVVLTGVHLGGYGGDLSSNLVQLITAILQDTDIARIRLGSLEPWELSDDFFALFANPRLMPHLHLPLQSGCDATLRQMARRCSCQEFAAIVAHARTNIADFNISTDIIVGFPGETPERWRKSYDFVASTGFGHIHIFSYSPRAGTKAATLPMQIPSHTKKQRSQQLHLLAAKMKTQFMQQNIGKTYPVLWEKTCKTTGNHTLQFGYTPNYLRIACKIAPPHSLENQIINTHLVANATDYLVGENSVGKLQHS